MNELANIRITVLVDNVSNLPRLKAEHGFSCLIEADGHRVLFDTGAADALAHNVHNLGIALSGLDALVFSHGHYDHTGGLPGIASELGPLRIVAHPALLGSHHSQRTGKDRDIGIPKSSRLALEQFRSDFAREPREVVPGIWTTGEIPRLAPGADEGELFTDSAGTQPDSVPDDLALVLCHRAGLVVVVGCAHAGVENTLAWAAQLAPRAPLLGVLGGMHLDRAPSDRIQGLIEGLQRSGVSFVVPGHCTGDRAKRALQDAFGERFESMQTGMQIVIHPDGHNERFDPTES